MNVKSLLPVGSVVLLKDGQKKLVVIGVMQTDADTGKDYDYLGILYPEGYLGDQFQYLFNREDINEIIFRGYEDEEREQFLKKLEQVICG